MWVALSCALTILSMLSPALCFRPLEEWTDQSPHRTILVEVAPNVRLEVLDWGGRGRPLVLLTGSGLTAHIYDEIAPKLTDCCHVYAITRRGFGASSHPDSGYDDQRLADDVLRVIDALKLQRPVLVGHSMAGGELTTLGHQHSQRVGGLVYLDALADPRDNPAGDPAFQALLPRIPKEVNQKEPPDYSSFTAYRAWQVRTGVGAFPEAELRQLFELKPDGTMGSYKASTGAINQAIGQGQKKRDYSGITVPVLALVDLPRARRISELRADEYHPKNDEERATFEAMGKLLGAYSDRWVANLKGHVPGARVVNLDGAGHYLFLTRQEVALREIHAFVAGPVRALTR